MLDTLKMSMLGPGNKMSNPNSWDNMRVYIMHNLKDLKNGANRLLELLIKYIYRKWAPRDS